MTFLRSLAGPVRRVYVYGTGTYRRHRGSPCFAGFASSSGAGEGGEVEKQKEKERTTNSLKRYELHATGAGGTTTTTVRGHTIRTDLPKKMGGKDEHPQPVEYLLAALVGCEQATAAFVARQMKPRMLLKGMTFEYVGVRDDRGATSLPLDAPAPVPARLVSVKGTATVHLVEGTETLERIDELRRITEARCPVANTLSAGGVELDIRWVLSGNL